MSGRGTPLFGEDNVNGTLAEIDATLEELAKLDEITADIAELSQELDNAEAQLTDKVDAESRDQMSKQNVAILLLIIILILILLNMFLEWKKEKDASMEEDEPDEEAHEEAYGEDEYHEEEYDDEGYEEEVVPDTCSFCGKSGLPGSPDPEGDFVCDGCHQEMSIIEDEEIPEEIQPEEEEMHEQIELDEE